MRETWSVGRAKGVALADDFVDKQLAFGDTLPYEMRASMLHDLDAGNRLEAPWLCGAVVRLGREAGVPTPVNATVYTALIPYVNGAPTTVSRLMRILLHWLINAAALFLLPYVFKWVQVDSVGARADRGAGARSRQRAGAADAVPADAARSRC